jgi:hypothetical protein
MQGLTGLGNWSVCNEYEIRGGKIVARYKLSALEDPLRPEDVWWYYSPLSDAPDLILKFARLYKEKSFERAALAFSHKYGLPNSTVAVVEGKEKAYPFAEEIEVSDFWDEAEKAHRVLALYEAVINRDAETVKQYLLGRYSVGKTFVINHEALSIVEEWQGPNGILHAGLDYVINVVQDVVQGTCRQRIRAVPQNRTQPPDLSNTETVWDFDSLYGAMYLEMWWLIVSGNNIGRCEFCGSPISLGRSHPIARKRRSDKRFCDAACRQAHHRSKKMRGTTDASVAASRARA